jgi:hypothetical protein
MHDGPPSSGTEIKSFNTTDGLVYQSGVYLYNSGKSGCSFKRDEQRFPEDTEIFPP